MNYTVVVLGGILLLSVIWYYFPKYGAVHWFTGPLRTIDAGDTISTGAEQSRSSNDSDPYTKDTIRDAIAEV